jgi:hypothetical protein
MKRKNKISLDWPIQNWKNTIISIVAILALMKLAYMIKAPNWIIVFLILLLPILKIIDIWNITNRPKKYWD